MRKSAEKRIFAPKIKTETRIMAFTNLRRMSLMLAMGVALFSAHAQQYARRTNLPAVYINTYSGQDVTSKTEYVMSTLRYVDESDSVVTYDSVQIRGRGNSTWNMAKKPYRIKFNTKQKFLGKGYAKAKSWTLLANAADKTLMRNAITSAMGKFEGLKFNPACKFVDFILNGVYMGNYQISDQVDVRKHRVDITEQDEELTSESDITGGYLLEVDGFADGNCFRTNNYNVPVRIHYPDEDDIKPSQTTYISQYVRAFENRIAGGRYLDPELGYRRMIDSTSFADWYIATEVSANIDGFYSIYFYKDQNDSLLYWGPLWDYDIAYNNDSRKPGTADKMMSDIGYGDATNWVNRMWDDPWFSSLINRRYKELLDQGLVDYMLQIVDSIDNLIEPSRELNYEKWGIRRRMYHEIVLYSSYDQYVTDLKNFITQHTEYLRTAFASKYQKPAEPTPEFVPGEYYYTFVNAGTSSVLDADGNNIEGNGNDDSKESQFWYFRPAGDGYMIVNRGSGLALNDPTPGASTATSNVGTQLNLADADASDSRQQWQLLPQGTAGYYNLLNIATSHVANLRGGSAADGTPILSYTNDDRNSSSNNRLWYIIQDEPLPDDVTGIESIGSAEYALAYSPVDGYLHFGSDHVDGLNFYVQVFTASGQRVGRFKACDGFYMTSLPAGTYIITWNEGNNRRSVKMMK